MPVYNGERYLRRALDSLLAQDYGFFELVISDNASTDLTREICEEYAARDSRIVLNVHAQNLGLIPNFQLVLDRARGKYFMWSAHDDIWAKTFVGTMVRELENHVDAGVAMSAIHRVHENGATFDLVRYPGRANPNRMTALQLALALAEGSPHHLFIYGLFRTEFLRQAFQNFPRVIACDRLMIMQAALSKRFRFVDEVLHIRCVHDEPLAVRRKDDEIGKAWLAPRAHLKRDFATGPYLLRSRIIPWQRKVWVPVIAIWQFLHSTLSYNFVLQKIFGQGGRRKRIAPYLRRWYRS